ncbi:hypothetical protein BDQ17DRAFT_835432 [Cyathus striatus]|nr:hypothetical protein BDQ17DRAFT_835432 [Cyathus striatus]
MEGYQMPPEAHYAQRPPQQPQQQQQQQQPQQQQWPPHLLPPSHSHSQQPFPSPPPSDHSGHYPSFYPAPPQPQERPTTTGQTSATLSLNLSSLTVASPTNLSPINGPSSALSPVTPISPSTNPFTAQGPQAQQAQSPFQFDPNQSTSGQQDAYDEHGNMIPPGSSAGYDSRRTPGPSRSSTASSSSQLPRKRSFTSGTVEESMYEDSMEGYDDVDVRSAYPSGAGGDGSGSTSGAEDGSGTASGGTGSGGVQMGGNMGGSMNVLGKPMAVNNFVTKLYQ